MLFPCWEVRVENAFSRFRKAPGWRSKERFSNQGSEVSNLLIKVGMCPLIIEFATTIQGQGGNTFHPDQSKKYITYLLDSVQ